MKLAGKILITARFSMLHFLYVAIVFIEGADKTYGVSLVSLKS